MKLQILLSLLTLTFIVTLSGCAKNEVDSAEYLTITPKEAKEMMDNNEDIIILDVRSLEEYQEGHIENAILIPDSEINTSAEEILPDKEATILVYCRSGRRSALASKDLADMGYTNIYDFGGIIDWNYDVVTE